MKYIILPFLLLATSLNFASTTPDESCYPNVTRVNMCRHADAIVTEWNKILPQAAGTTATITHVQAEGATVFIHTDLVYTQQQILTMAATRNITLEDLRANWKNIMSDSIKQSGCDRPLFIAFVGLGGVYQYHYHYKDGGLFSTIIQRECPDD